MEYTFTLYEPHRERMQKNDDPLVELRPNGRIMFNKRASELLNNQHFCMLGYDEDNKAIGLKLLPERNINAFSIRYATKGAYIGAKKFFRHFNILPAEQIQYPPNLSGDFISVHLSPPAPSI